MTRATLPLLLALLPTAALAQTPPCEVGGRDVSFETPLSLLADPPPPAAMVEHPFAEVHRARSATVRFAEGSPEVADVRVETTRVQLQGLVHTGSIALHPTEAAPFGGVMIPLAHHRLRVTAVAGDRASVALGPTPRVHHAIAPEARGCATLSLTPGRPFPWQRLLPRGARRIPTPRGVWSFHASPDASEGSRAQVFGSPRDRVWLLETGDALWRRMLWVTDTVALLGWTRPPHAPQSFGYGTGHGVRRRTGERAPTTRCPRPIVLYAMLRGQARAVGRILTDTPFTVGAREGERLAVTVSDPDVDWAEGVTLAISMYDILGCTPP